MNTSFERIKKEKIVGLFGSNIRKGKDEWLTPPEIIKALGPFDLDPCAPINRPWSTVTQHYTITEALTFARTETKMFFDMVWDRADAVLFLKGRIRFYHVDGTMGGSAGAPSVLIAYGKNNIESLVNSGLIGKLIIL